MSRRSAPTLTPRLFDRRRGRAPGIGAWDGGQPIALADLPDALGVTRKMQVEKWAWLIGLSDADDSRLLEWARSFATPPQVKAEGARLQSPAYNTERRGTLLTVEKPIVSLTITPSTPCVHPVFELHQAPKTLARIELSGQPLPANDYAWDGRTLWLNTTLRGGTRSCPWEIATTCSPRWTPSCRAWPRTSPEGGAEEQPPGLGSTASSLAVPAGTAACKPTEPNVRGIVGSVRSLALGAVGSAAA